MKKNYFFIGIVIFGMLLFVAHNKDDIRAPKIESASVDSGDIENWDYTGTSYYLGNQDIFPEGISWDGTNWWMIGSDSDKIHKYNSDWSYSGVSYDIFAQCSTPTGICWDGTNWWVVGDGVFNSVYRYNSDWSYTGYSHNVGGNPKGIYWDGLNWWVINFSPSQVSKYNSDWSYTGISYDLSGQDTYPSDLFWDGVNWWVSGIYSDATHKYNSDWSYTGISYDTSGQDNYPTDIFWDGVNWWMLGYGNSRVFEYGDLNNEFENAPPDLNLFLTYIIVGLSIGIFGISLIFIYVLKVKKKKAQTLVREIIDNKKIQQKSTVQRNKKENLCPFCGTANLKGWKFCTSCGKRMKSEKKKIDSSEFLGGFIISLIGGLSSIALGFGIPFVYPELVYYIEDAMLILQTIMIIGGVVSIIGAILIFSKPKLGGAIVLVGGFIAGINIITIIGASRTFKKIRS